MGDQMKTQIGAKVVSTLFAMLATLTLVDGLFSQAIACDYYASPSGGGNGLSQSSPFKIANFWKVAAPGKTLCLLDGVYSDPITPPQNLNGTASARITVRALNDGKVRINGGGVRNPVSLKNNDYFVLEGFDAHNSSGTVILISTGADHNIVRRVCAWDAPDNTIILLSGPFTTIPGTCLRTCAALAQRRKIFSNSQRGNNVTIRRAWGRWERSLNTSPKVTFANGYNSINSTYENVIGTWDETAMGGVLPTQPLAILRIGPITSSNVFCQNNKYLGSIAYIRAADKAAQLNALVLQRR